MNFPRLRRFWERLRAAHGAPRPPAAPLPYARPRAKGYAHPDGRHHQFHRPPEAGR